MSVIPTAAADLSPIAGETSAVENLLVAFRTMTEGQRTEIASLLGLAATPSKKVSVSTKKSSVPAARKAAAAAPLPEPEEDGAPSAASYRMKEEDIDHTICVGRVLKGCKDRRWSPAVYREIQCGKAPEEGCDICKICQTRLEKYAEEPKPGDWTGRVTEAPPGWLHMLGTEWAEARKPKWLGEEGTAAASDSGSEASSAASSAASSKKETKAAAAEEAKAKKAAEKEAAKAEKEAAKAKKAAEKEEAKAKKAAEKEEAKAKKAAEKEEAKKEASAKKEPAAKKETKAAAKKEPAAKKAVADAPAKADTAASATEVELELKLLEGEIYAIKGQNVYKYDDDSEEAGEFVGRLTADETIDREATEKEEDD
jgi:chemotaxis protein histidine kinase CheA